MCFPKKNEDKIDTALERYGKSRIGRQLKKTDLGTTISVNDVITIFNQKISDFDIQITANYAKNTMTTAIQNYGIQSLLEIYDSKMR